MTSRRSAYDIPYEKVVLTSEQQRQALRWWQRGEAFHPLICPVCAAVLRVGEGVPELLCPTAWCSYVTREIPWGIYVAWRRTVSQGGEEGPGADETLPG